MADLLNPITYPNAESPDGAGSGFGFHEGRLPQRPAPRPDLTVVDEAAGPITPGAGAVPTGGDRRR
ncbi:hypothetical protein [Natronorubrum sp. FCH18a]|uniref:hypothetical protein n=1 Tax=Natronorubrum sp. FCH18a TaxID=3447018 RepID=UPI003F51593D